MRLPRFLSRKENPANRSILSMYSLGQAVWTPADFANLANEGYVKCAAAFSAVSLISKTASRIEWTLMRKGQKGQKGEFDDHPLLQLLRRPNGEKTRFGTRIGGESGARLQEKIFAFLLIDGNSYITAVRGIESAPPTFLYTLRPDRMKIITGNWQQPVAGYEYNAGANPTKFKSEDILHLMEFHPTNDWYGLSRLQVAGHLIDTLNEGTAWNKRILQNDMRTPGMMTAPALGNLQKFKEMFRAQYQGSENAGMPIILEGRDIEWKDLAKTAKEMDWLEGLKLTTREIIVTLGSDPILHGDAEYSTYSNREEAKKGLYHETVLPLVDIYRDELNAWLVPYYGDKLYLDYDRDKIEAIQEDRGKKYAYLNLAKWLTLNEKRVACGYDEIEGGDVILVGMGDLPLDQALAEPEPPPDFTPDDEDKPDEDDEDKPAKHFRPFKGKSLGAFWRGENERKALWQNFERRITAKERLLVRDVRAYLETQAKSVVAKAGQGITNADLLLNRAEAEKSYTTRFKSRYLKLFASALAAGRHMTEGKLYDFTEDDKADPPGISDALRAKLETLIEEAARVITDETLSEIQAVLREATGTNLTVQEIANALKDKLVDQMPDVRARRIARTETGMLENFGNLEGFKENEYVNAKVWICSFVEASRDEHKEADGQEVGIDEDFNVGGESLEYPGDRRGGASAGNVINCLCTVAPVVR